jgi:ABC-2 type transport system permease protein
VIAVLRHMLRRATGAILGWGLSLGLLALFMAQFYDTLAEQRTTLENLIANYPRELMAFFGGGENIFSPQGFLSMEFFSLMPVVLGIYAVLSGSGLFVRDEETGCLDLLLAHPVSRTRFFMGSVIAAALSLAAILAMVWAGFFAGASISKELELSGLELLRPVVGLLAVVFLFQALGLALSMVLPSRSAAAMASGLLLVGSYFVNSLAELDRTLDRLADFLPLRYYQSGYAIEGLHASWVSGLAGAGVAFVLLAWLLFVRRDIRVSGEGAWGLPALGAVRSRRGRADEGGSDVT